jgi:hypothetical protein
MFGGHHLLPAPAIQPAGMILAAVELSDEGKLFGQHNA